MSDYLHKILMHAEMEINRIEELDDISNIISCHQTVILGVLKCLDVPKQERIALMNKFHASVIDVLEKDID